MSLLASTTAGTNVPLCQNVKIANNFSIKAFFLSINIYNFFCNFQQCLSPAQLMEFAQLSRWIRQFHFLNENWANIHWRGGEARSGPWRKTVLSKDINECRTIWKSVRRVCWRVEGAGECNISKKKPQVLWWWPHTHSVKIWSRIFCQHWWEENTSLATSSHSRAWRRSDTWFVFCASSYGTVSVMKD